MTTQRTRRQTTPPRRAARQRIAAGAAVAAIVAGSAAFAAAAPAAAAEPDFGPNVTIFEPGMSVDDINATLASLANEPEFSQNRHAVFFEPGTYGSAAGQDDPSTATGIVNAELGYYTAIAGLGASPEDVRINGALHVEPVRACEPNPWDCQQPGSLTRFWRSLGNMTINPIQRPVGVDATRPFPSGVTDPHTMRFAVSQAAPLRRMNIEGDLTLFGRVGEYASGGYLANSNVDGRIITGSQQQWFTRDSTVGTWDGGVWNMVFSGVDGAPATDFAPGNKTNVGATPVSREAPYLYLDGDDYKVFVPTARTETSGHEWSTDAAAGDAIAISDFFIAHEGDTAAKINTELASGKHLLLTPGVYHLDAPIVVDRADTVVLGLGYASLTPDTGTAALEVGDVEGVKIAGITVDAGPIESEVLVKIGPDSASVADATNPTTLSDVFIRVGGPWAGKAATSIEVNSDDVLLDHIWAWRADHGTGVAWDLNTGAHGVVVNGDDVTATGLFVEHYQEEQVIWNGERGRTIFYQSEIPYDPPTQAAYLDGDRLGFASYRVADAVTSHLAQGLGVYSFFDPTINGGQDIRVESGIQTPKSANVRFESMTSVFLNGTGGINHIVNDAGAPAVGSFASPQLASYPPADTTAPTVAIAADPATPGPDGTYTSEVTLTVSATDDYTPPPTLEANVDGAGWQPVTAPIMLGDGQHTVDARATDASGNVSAIASWSGTIAVVVVEDVPLAVKAHTQCLDGKAHVVVSAVNGAALAADIRLTTVEGTVKFTKVAPGATVTYLWKAGKKLADGSATVAGYTWSDGQGKYSSYEVPYTGSDCGTKK